MSRTVTSFEPKFAAAFVGFWFRIGLDAVKWSRGAGTPSAPTVLGRQLSG